MKKILHYIALDVVGGAEVLFHELLEQFPHPTATHNIALYTSSLHPFFKETVSRNTDSIYSIKYCRAIKLPKKPSFIRKWNNRRILNSVNADVVFFWNSMDHDNYLEPEFYRRNSKSIFYDHGTSWYREKQYASSKLFLSHTDLTLCCSNASKRVLELYHQHRGPMRVIHNPLRPGFFLEPANEKSLPNHRSLRIGIAGRFVHIKGIALAIHSIALLKSRGVDVELYIAGTGRYGPAYKKLVRRLDIENQVHFLGLVEDMAGFFSNIDIFVCPSIREPFGIVAVEAMGKGCPLVCARVDGLAEVVKPGQTGISLTPGLPLESYERLGGGLNGLPEYVYNPDLDDLETPKVVDPGDIADAVQHLISDSDAFREMSGACIRDVNERFGFEGYLARMAAAINQVFTKLESSLVQ